MASVTLGKNPAPTGLVITNEGNGRFTCTWKQGDQVDKQEVRFTYRKDGFVYGENGPAGEIPVSDTTFVATINYNNSCYPRNYALDASAPMGKPGYLEWVKFEIRCRTGGGMWSKWISSTYRIQRPDPPTIESAWEAGNPNRSTYTWSTPSDNVDRPVTDIELQTVKVKNAPADTKGLSQWQAAPATSQELSGNTYYDETGLAGNSYKRAVRIRARGPAGASDWVYAEHVFAEPYKARQRDAVAQFNKSSQTYQLKANYQFMVSATHPVDSVALRYCVGTPQAGMLLPSSPGWTDAVVSNGISSSSTIASPWDLTMAAEIDRQLQADECMWIQATATHDNHISYSEVTIVVFGKLATPTGFNITSQNASTHKVNLSITNNSSVPDSNIAIVWQPSNRPEESFVCGIIEHGQTAITGLQCPDWTRTGTLGFRAYAYQGNESFTTAANGVKKYRLYTNMVSDSVSTGGGIPLAPASVTLSKSEYGLGIVAEWPWTWADANQAEIAWSTRPNALQSTQQPESYTLDSVYEPKFDITGLTSGVTYYVWVRLMFTDADGTTYGPWSDPASMFLTEIPLTPVVRAEKTLIRPLEIPRISWSYYSPDGSQQSYAEIAEIVESGGQTVYQHLAERASEQSAAIYKKWPSNSQHQISVRVVSENNQSSAWSDPITITVAEPLHASIMDTSLDYGEDLLNPTYHSGEMVTVNGGTESLTKAVAHAQVTLTPLQPNAYDSVWVGGAGKNICPFDIPSMKSINTGGTWNGNNYTYRGVTFAVNSNGSITVSGTATAEVALYLVAIGTSNLADYLAENTSYICTGCPSGGTSSTYRLQFQHNGTWGNDYGSGVTWTYTSGGNDCVRIDILSGYTASNLTFRPMIRVSGTSADYEPYSNICPISGHTAVSVNRTGKNRYDMGSIRSAKTGTTWTVSGNSLTINADGTGTYQGVNLGNATDLLFPAGTYYIKCNVVSIQNAISSTQMGFRNASNVFRGTTIPLTTTGQKAVTVTITEPCYFSTIVTWSGTGTTNRVVIDNLMVSTSDSTYEPYNGTTTTTDLGRTVYGGTLDVVTGELTVTQAGVNMGSLTWSAGTDSRGQYFYTNIADMKPAPSSSVEGDFITSAYPVYPASNIIDKSIGCSNATNPRVFCRDTSYANATAFKTGVSGYQLVYELATPQVYQLTPKQVALIAGTNNVWSENGSIDLTLADAVRKGYVLRELPLTVTATGAGTAGQTTITITRAEDFVQRRPDEEMDNAYAGATIIRRTFYGEAQQTFTLDDIIEGSKLDDTARYKLNVQVKDSYGQTANKSRDFKVQWTQQAVFPEGEVEIRGTAAYITVNRPEDASGTETVDIYRKSADRPVLIYQGATFGETIVDPYPAIGPFGGYRLVLNTKNGDCTTARDELAWLDIEKEFKSLYQILDFDGRQLRVVYNTDLDSTWEKDFQVTKYLGGSQEGDWLRGTNRTGSISGVLLDSQHIDDVAAFRYLADYSGPIHVRTKDGSSYTANVNVTERESYQTAGRQRELTLSLTRTNPAKLDGMTQAEWEA